MTRLLPCASCVVFEGLWCFWWLCGGEGLTLTVFVLVVRDALEGPGAAVVAFVHFAVPALVPDVPLHPFLHVLHVLGSPHKLSVFLFRSQYGIEKMEFNTAFILTRKYGIEKTKFNTVLMKTYKIRYCCFRIKYGIGFRRIAQ